MTRPSAQTNDPVATALANIEADMVSQTDTSNQTIASLLSVNKRASDPSTVGWGEAQKGLMWFNTTEGTYKYWNGTSTVPYPSAGGAGAPDSASYVTINAEAGLSAETQHANIAEQGQLHVCKYHAATHISAGTDPFTNAQLLEAIVKRWQESSGPTTLTAGAVADGQYLRRSGSTIIGDSAIGSGTYRLAPTYTIYKVGSDYYALDDTGTVDYGGSADAGGVDGADCHAVVNATLTAMGNASPNVPPQGWLHFKKGTFSIDDQWTIYGEGGATFPTHQFIVTGEGRDTKIDQTATAKKIFVFQNNACFSMENLQLHMLQANDANSESALHLSSGGAVKRSCHSSYINNVWLSGGDNTHPLAYFENIMHLTVGLLVAGSEYGPALKIHGNNAGEKPGNSHFQFMRLGAAGTGTALEITTTGANPMNLLTFGRVDCYNGENCGINIHGKVSSIHFDDANVEYLNDSGSAVILDDDATGALFDVIFDHLTFGIPANGYGINVDGANNCHVRSGDCWDEGTPNKVLQEVGNTRFANSYSFGVGTNVLNTAGSWNITSSTKPHLDIHGFEDDTDWHLLQSRVYDATATIANGQTSIVVDHHFGQTPTHVIVSGSTADTKDVYADVSTFSATQMTLTVGAAVGGNRTVYYSGGWYP